MLAEAGLAQVLEQAADAAAGQLADQRIQVDETQAEALGHAAPQAGLSGAGGADEYKVAGRVHRHRS